MRVPSASQDRKTLRQRWVAHGVLAVLAIAFAMVLGCGSGDRPLEAVDPDAVPTDPTWNQVFSIIQRECKPCHGDGGEDPRYVTPEDVLDGLDDLYEEVFEENTMPPGAWPRLTSEEKLAIQRWIDNGANVP